MFVIRLAFHPSFVQVYINHSKGVRNSVFIVLCSVSFFSVKTWMEGTRDVPYKNPYFFVTTGPNRMGLSPRCR